MSTSHPHPVSVLLADAHPIFRAGLRAILTVDDQIVVMSDTSDGRTLTQTVDEFKPDVVITDFDLADGTALHAIKAIKSTAPRRRVLVVAARSDIGAVVAALDAGADGFLLKTCQPDELRTAVKAICNGERVLDRTAVSMLVDRGTRQFCNSSPHVESLSNRERDILEWLASGATSKEIALKLGLRPKTVENHRARILDKLGAVNSAAAVRIATATGLIGQAAYSVPIAA